MHLDIRVWAGWRALGMQMYICFVPPESIWIWFQTNTLTGSQRQWPVSRVLLDSHKEEATRTLLRMQHMAFCLALMLGHMEQWSHRLCGRVLIGCLTIHTNTHTHTEQWCFVHTAHGEATGQWPKTFRVLIIFHFISSMRLHFGNFTSDWIGYFFPDNTHSFTLQQGEVITGVRFHHGNLPSTVTTVGTTIRLSAFTFYTNTGGLKLQVWKPQAFCSWQSSCWVSESFDTTSYSNRFLSFQQHETVFQVHTPRCIAFAGAIYGPYGDTTDPALNVTTVTGRQLLSLKINYGLILHEISLKFIRCEWTNARLDGVISMHDFTLLALRFPICWPVNSKSLQGVESHCT